MKLMEKKTNFDRTTNMLDIHVKVWIPEILEFTTPAFGNALARQGASQTPVVFNFESRACSRAGGRSAKRRVATSNGNSGPDAGSNAHPKPQAARNR